MSALTHNLGDSLVMLSNAFQKLSLEENDNRSAITGAATEFTLFPKLPAEVRIKIWNAHINNSGRVVQLQLTISKGYRPKKKYEWLSPGLRSSASLDAQTLPPPILLPQTLLHQQIPSPWLPGRNNFVYTNAMKPGLQWTSNTELPSILLINHESRHEGLKVYKKAFPTSVSDHHRFAGIICFNPATDTIYLDSEVVRTNGGLTSGYVDIPEDMRSLKSIRVEALMFQLTVVEDFARIKDGRDPHTTLALETFRETFPNLEVLELAHEMDIDRGVTFVPSYADVFGNTSSINSRVERQHVRKAIKEDWYGEVDEGAEDSEDEDEKIPMPILRSVSMFGGKRTKSAVGAVPRAVPNRNRFVSTFV